jgi:hypothetical protein
MAGAAPPTPSPALKLVADGFTWAENLDFDGKGHLFVTNDLLGQLWKISANGDGSYSQHLYFYGVLQYACGVVVNESDPSTMFLAGIMVGDSKHVILELSTTANDSWRVAAELPIGADGSTPNGLRIDYGTDLLYTTNEGKFAPGEGHVWSVNPRSGAVQSALPAGQRLTAADGVWISRERVLLVSQVSVGNVWSMNLASGTNNGVLPQGVHGMLDDLCTDPLDERFIFGANFLKGAVVYFDPSNAALEPVVVVSGLYTPTSVRFGTGNGFKNTSLFITEGGGTPDLPHENTRRVWELENALDYVHTAH